LSRVRAFFGLRHSFGFRASDFGFRYSLTFCDQRREPGFGLQGEEKFAVEEIVLRALNLPGDREAVLPFEILRRVERGGEVGVHLLKKFSALRRVARECGNLVSHL